MTKKRGSPNGQSPPYQAIVIDSGLTLTDNGWVIEDTRPDVAPQFTVSEVAKVFFKKSPYWIRWNEDRGFFELDGKPIANTRKIIHPLTKEQKEAKKAGRRVKANVTYFLDERREGEVPEGVRSYTLYDIERMAYALMSRGAIDSLQLLGTLRIIESVARMYRTVGGSTIEVLEVDA